MVHWRKIIMIKKVDKNQVRQKRHQRIRNKVKGTESKPRLNVYRSLNGIYVQIIDDTKGITLVSASSKEKAIQADLANKTKVEVAKIVGLEVGKKALAKGIETVVFDRAGYLFTGRVKALADGAREAGLKF